MGLPKIEGRQQETETSQEWAWDGGFVLDMGTDGPDEPLHDGAFPSQGSKRQGLS